MKFKIILLISLLFISCKSTKTTDTTIVKDSIRTSTQLNIIKGGVNLMRFESPCDSLGNLRPIFYNSSLGSLKTTIQSDKGSILIKQEQKPDTIYKEKLVYKDKLIYKDKLVEVEKRYIPKWVWYNLALSILLIGWTFRRFIPALNIFR